MQDARFYINNRVDAAVSSDPQPFSSTIAAGRKTPLPLLILKRRLALLFSRPRPQLKVGCRCFVLDWDLVGLGEMLDEDSAGCLRK